LRDDLLAIVSREIWGFIFNFIHNFFFLLLIS
jgi:hypothetical protein